MPSGKEAIDFNTDKKSRIRMKEAIIEDLFKDLGIFLTGSKTWPPEKKSPKPIKTEIDYLPHCSHEVIERIMCMYAEGVAISDISIMFALDANLVIDHFAPHW